MLLRGGHARALFFVRWAHRGGLVGAEMKMKRREVRWVATDLDPGCVWRKERDRIR